MVGYEDLVFAARRRCGYCIASVKPDWRTPAWAVKMVARGIEIFQIVTLDQELE
jgi:hypothetical protein